MARQFLINSFFMVNDEGRKRPAKGIVGLCTHKILSAYVSRCRARLARHGEWLLINGMDVSINIELKELEAACGEQ